MKFKLKTYKRLVTIHWISVLIWIISFPFAAYDTFVLKIETPQLSYCFLVTFMAVVFITSKISRDCEITDVDMNYKSIFNRNI